MKKSKLGFKRCISAGMFALCIIVVSKIAIAQPEHKFSIQDKIIQEKQTESVAVNALAPESVFSKGEVTEALFQQTKLLARLMYESGMQESRKTVVPNERLPKAEGSSETLGASRQLTQLNESKRIKTIVEQPKNGFKKETSQTQVSKISSENFQPQITNHSSDQLIAHNDLQGTIDTLPYEKIEGRGTRFRYTQIPEEIIGHFWWFKSRDLRGKTIRVYYSGIVPHEITFLTSHSYWSAKAIYHFSLEDSPETKVLSFQIPNRLPFKDISVFELRIEKSHAGRPYGDFLIERVEVIADDHISTPIEIENQSHSFSFGGPYLQSNIWGGEVKTS